jgi:hypothetical protein
MHKNRSKSTTSFITLEEICDYMVKQYNGDTTEVFEDLKAVLTARNLINEDGTVSYNNFRKWMSSTIEPKEEYYFRHDAIDNPAFNSIKQK